MTNGNQALEPRVLIPEVVAPESAIDDPAQRKFWKVLASLVNTLRRPSAVIDRIDIEAEIDGSRRAVIIWRERK